ncbi:NACHT and WD repeat domain-containing protein [Nonomuraea sp. H19]|uniref:NACHT and WD repeat domain-containing protein n=1 Tax=Nonomuraea sp. H19 TaxID=3452206 RepID=UPI003F8A19C7
MGKGDTDSARFGPRVGERQGWREAVGTVRNQNEVCPYQGLAPFESDKSELFFGRRRAVRDLLERLGSRLRERGSILLVSGASGVGKSSLLRAGLMPALAEGTPLLPGSRDRPRLLVTPTLEPFRALAEAWAQAYGGSAEDADERLRAGPEEAGERLRVRPDEVGGRSREHLERAGDGAQERVGEAGPPDGRFVLVVDQFEELFTLVADERERQAFVQTLYALAGAGAAVIIGVRADYWDRCAAYPQLAEAIQDGQVIVEPMTEPDLRLAIAGPAAAVGLELEAGLVEIILRELRAGGDQAGGVQAGGGFEAASLPLLSQALLNTWERREDGRLTIRGYEDSGQVRFSVQRTADELLDRLSPADRKATLRIFRRMTMITSGGRLVRRSATWAELHAAAAADSEQRRARVGELLSAFAGLRLITLHEDRAEIAHDALLPAWPTLRQWIEPDLTAHAVYDRLVEDAGQWAENHRDPAFLYRGARLLAVQDSRPRWDRDPGSFPPPGPVVNRFVVASVGAVRRAGRRRAFVMAGLATLSVLALLAAGIAVNAANNADEQRLLAVQERQLAVSRRLAMESEVTDDPVTSALLAVTAWRLAETPETRRRLLDVAARADRGIFSAQDSSVDQLLFSPTGSIIATGYNGTVRLWDPATHRQLGDPIVHEGLCVFGFEAAFSPNGKVLATACFHEVVFWDVVTRRPLGPPLDVVDGVRAMAFSLSGRTLATATTSGTVRLWDIVERQQAGALIGRADHNSVRNSIDQVAFSPDGKRLISAGADDTARVWDLATRRQIGKALTGHAGDISGISLSPDGGTLATVSVADRTARLWNLTTYEQIGGVLRGTGSDLGFYAVAFSPDGTRLATGGRDGYTRLWDTASRQQVGDPLTNRRFWNERLAFSPDGRTLAAADVDGQVWLWDPTAHRQLGAAMPGTYDVAFSLGGKTLAASDPVVAMGTDRKDSAVRFFDVATRREAGPRLRPEDDPVPREWAGVRAIRFSREGRTLTTAGTDGAIRRWDAATRRQIGHADRLGSFGELSADGGLSAFWVLTGNDGSVAIWDVVGRREAGLRIVVKGHTSFVPAKAFSPDGSILALAGSDQTVRLFDVATRRQIGEPLHGAATDQQSALAFSGDGKLLATTAADGTVRLWDVASRRQKGVILTGHTNSVGAMAFSPDGRTLATGSGDRTVRLWDVPTLRQVGPALTGHAKTVADVAFSPDGALLATASADLTLRLWNVAAPADPAAAVCAQAGRSFTRAEWRRYVEGEEFRQVCP